MNIRLGREEPRPGPRPVAQQVLARRPGRRKAHEREGDYTPESPDQCVCLRNTIHPKREKKTKKGEEEIERGDLRRRFRHQLNDERIRLHVRRLGQHGLPLDLKGFVERGPSGRYETRRDRPR